MLGEEEALELVVDEFRRLVPVALYLVDDDFHLVRHLFVGIGAGEGYVEEQVDGSADVPLQASAVIDRLLFACEGIEFSAHTFHAGDDLTCRASPGSLERHVLCEMRHAALLRQFVACAGIDCEAEIDCIRPAWSTDDAESLWKRVSGEHLVKREGGKPLLLPAFLL